MTKYFYYKSKYLISLFFCAFFLTARNYYFRKTSDVVISLTSYGPRINIRLFVVLLSLIGQSIKPKVVNLYLCHADAQSMPYWLMLLRKINIGINVIEVEDTKSYKKLLPIIASNYDGFFITADDDLFYPRSWLKRLLKIECKENEIICVRMHRIKIFGKAISNYSSFEFESNFLEASSLNMATTGSGVLFHTKNFSGFRDVTYEEIEKNFENVDDIFCWYVIRRNGYKYKKVIAKSPYELYDPGYVKYNLNYKNSIDGSYNDKAFYKLYKNKIELFK